jgi:hypothetical protein
MRRSWRPMHTLLTAKQRPLSKMVCRDMRNLEDFINQRQKKMLIDVRQTRR